MYTAIHHYTMRFNGYLNYYFTFDIRYTEAEAFDGEIRNADIMNIFELKENGYLYIQGCRITNNKDGIRTIMSQVRPGGNGDSYSDLTFSVDSSGYVVLANSNHSSNQVDRFLSKLFGK